MNVPFPLPKHVTTDDVKQEIQELQANVSRVIEMRGAVIANLVALEEEAKRLLLVAMISPLDERPLIGISEMNFGQCAAAHVFSGVEVHVLDDVLRFAVTADGRFVVSTYSGHGKTDVEPEEVRIDGRAIEGIEVCASGAAPTTVLIARSADDAELKVNTADVLALFVDRASLDWRERARLASQATTGGAESLPTA
jgi:hypothetical protein